MALVIKDRVKEQTTTTGTGSVTLTGAVAGFESFSAVGDGNTTYYAIVHQSLSEWEVGLGTYTASGTTLSRDTVLDSSNSGSAVNFSAGVKDVFVTYAADKAVYRDASGDVSVTFATSATNATTAVSATNATTAVSATNATTAVSATNATSATFATSATNATTAITATSATNATNAVSATFAASATNATSATFATSATNATTAITATSATNATTAVSATNATTAVSATNATSATFATSATNATTAITATSATNATNAVSATFAASATNATSATFATSATNATTAITATSATNATNAVSATFAASATNATTAVSATNATSATFATNATNLDGGTVSATSGTFNTLIASGLTYPSTDGTASQIIQTNGSGTLSFVSVSGGATDIDGLSDAITNSSGQTIGLGTGALANDDGTTNVNTALGYNALNAVTSGQRNIGIGYGAGDSITTGSNNSIVGYKAGDKMTTGADNTLVGYSSGFNITNGLRNTLIGYESGYNISTADDIVAVGNNAGRSSGAESVWVGRNSGDAGTGGTSSSVGIGHTSLTKATSYGNTAVGASAGEEITTGQNNTLIGRDAGAFSTNLTTGTNNTIIGFNASSSSATVSNEITLGNTSITKFRIPGIDFVLKDNGGTPTTGQVLTADGSGEGYWATPSAGATDIDGLSDAITNSSGQTVGLGTAALANDDGTANYNTALGFNAGNKVTSGYRSVFIGAFAGSSGSSNITGFQNTVIGYQAGNVIEGSIRDATLVGFGAGSSITTGNFNTCIGSGSVKDATTGTSNTCIGVESGQNITTGSDNVCIGQNAGYNFTTGSRNIVVGSASQTDAVAGTDQVIIGYSITGKGNDTAFIGGTNGAYNEKNVTTWETTSDSRLKKNIVDNTKGLSVLSKVQVRNFEYRTEDEIIDLPKNSCIRKEGIQVGVIAQELQNILPECVSTNSTGVLSVNTDPLIWYLINAVKELSSEISDLKEQINGN